MLGNWDTGRVAIVTAPTITRRIEITMATMGRLMKNRDNSLTSGRGFFHEWFRIHLHAGHDLLDTLSNYTLARFQSVGDYPHRADTFTDLDCINAHFVVVVYSSHLVAALQFRDSTLRNEQRSVNRSHRGANFAVLPRSQRISRV